MMFAVVWYTILCVALNKVVSGGGSNLMTDEDIRNLTPEIYKERVEGSKWVFVSEHSFVGAIWSLKTCMLVIYARITYVANHMINKFVLTIRSEGLHQRRWINWLAIYVGLGFIATELTLFLICRPLSNYWAVPTSNCMSAFLSGLCYSYTNQRQINARHTNTTKSSKAAFTSPPTSSCSSSPFPF